MMKISRKRRKTIFFSFFAVVLLLAGAFTAGVFWYRFNLQAVAPEQGKDVKLYIAQGSNTAAIADRLQSSGLIRSVIVFRLYLLQHSDLVLKSGNYTMNTAWDVAKIASTLNLGTQAKTFRITFLPGGTLAAARERLQNVGYSDAQITQAFTKSYDHPLLKDKPANTSLEGFIYGDTYEFYEGADVETILTRSFDEMYQAILQNDLISQFKTQGLSLYQAIILASIVQGEAGSLRDDMPKITQIFYNRLHNNTPLGSDIVIGYYADQQNSNRSKTDMSYLTTTPCPWNSRRCTGLPPNPVNNPGLQALKAVANPNQDYRDYWYFLTGDDGVMYYAKTETEHEANKRYCPKLCGIL